MKRPNWQIVWNYLSQVEGSTIELYPEGENGFEFGVIDNTICAKSRQLTIGKTWEESEVVWLRFDISLNSFIKVCEKLPESTILNCVFATGMRKYQDESQIPETSI